MRVPGRPLRLLASVFALTQAARAAVIETVPAFNAPLAPTPVITQLRLDLTALNPSLTIPSLAPSALLASVQAAVVPAPVTAAPVAAAPVVATPAGAAPAAARVQMAQEMLGRWKPDEFAQLPEAERDAALSALWDGWKSRGLAVEPEGPSAADRLVLEAVDDKRLTSSGKSVFLGVAVLGYPLQDALWLARTRIRDAIDDNTLRYPEGQTWHTKDGTPEFLGVSPQAQGYVDAWAGATAYAKQIVAQVRAGSTLLPKSAAASPAAAAAFARVVEELWKSGDREAVDYLTGTDPTFTAFLLDARKPGYYLYNGERSVVARIMKTKAAGAMGVRRVEHPHVGLNASSTYLYRPRRVLDRLREVQGEPAGEYGGTEKALLADYIARLEPLVPAKAPAASIAPYSFADADTLPGSALDSPRNRLASYVQSPPLRRWDLPLPASSLRARFKSGERHPSLDEDRWNSLGRLLAAAPGLKTYDGSLRFVSERYLTRDRLIYPGADGKSIAIQMALLDEISRLERDEPAALPGFLRFAAAALDGAL